MFGVSIWHYENTPTLKMKSEASHAEHDDPILRKLYQGLQSNPELLISKMYDEKWSYTGAASAHGIWLSTSQVRAHVSAGMIEQVAVNDISFDGDLQFQHGSFRVVMPERPHSYNQVRLQAVVAKWKHNCATEMYRVLEAPPHVIAHITGNCFESRHVAAMITELVEHGYDLQIETQYRDVPLIHFYPEGEESPTSD